MNEETHVLLQAATAWKAGMAPEVWAGLFADKLMEECRGRGQAVAEAAAIVSKMSRVAELAFGFNRQCETAEKKLAEEWPRRPQGKVSVRARISQLRAAGVFRHQVEQARLMYIGACSAILGMEAPAEDERTAGERGAAAAEALGGLLGLLPEESRGVLKVIIERLKAGAAGQA